MPTYKEKKQRLRELVKQQQQQRIDLIRTQGHPFKPVDAFRVKEKQYKYYLHRQTDFSTLVDPKTLKRCHLEGMDHLEIYQIQKPQGAYLVKGFIKQETQFQVGFEAMNDFIRKPYRTNLDGTNGLYLQNQKEKKEEQQNVQYGIKEEETVEEEKKEEKQGMSIEENTLEKEETSIDKGYSFNDRIRMANLGYQYDWPHRCYPKTQVPIPATVANLTKQAQVLYQKLSQNEQLEYHGEAVIVNYYKPKEYMIGHLDDGQQDQINPIFSFNFGLSCVFLLGFPDKNVPPLALRLQAGDLLIMSGFSRICYHGVPRIIENSYAEPQFTQEIKDIAEKIDSQVEEPLRINGFKQILAYYKTHRLNLNVRQVWARKGYSNEGSEKMQAQQ